jgi:hypothetical protein
MVKASGVIAEAFCFLEDVDDEVLPVNDDAA